MGVLWYPPSSVTSDISMIRYICEPKHDHKHYGGVTTMDVDEKAMAYCLIEALFAAGLLNLPTYQNFLRMKLEQEVEPPAKAS